MENKTIQNIDTVNDSDFSDSDSRQIIEKEAKKIQITKEFRESVLKYVKIDDLIRKKQAEILELKNLKKPCEEYIIKYLDELDENIVELNDGKLVKNKVEQKVPLNQEIIKKAITDSVQDPDVVKIILDKMDKRPTNVKVNLKRTVKKEPKKKT